MARPILPLETEAEIEKAREKLFSSPPQAELPLFLVANPLSPRQRKPAQLKLALRSYASSLFDCEAKFYCKHAGERAKLQSWLEGLAACIEAEVAKEIASRTSGILTGYDFHCTAEERSAAIADALKERIDYWIKAAEADPKVTTAWEWTGRGKPISLAQMRTTELPAASPIAQGAEAATLAAQIDRLRVECRWTVEKLAEKIGVSPRSVQRHLSGGAAPYSRHIAAYEHEFSKQLRRKVVISKMSQKMS